MAENLRSVRHAADRLDVSEKTVYRMVSAGLLEHRAVGLGKKRPRIRVVESSLERYIAAKGEPTPPPPPRPTGPPKARGRAA